MGIWNFKAFAILNCDRGALLCGSLAYTSKYGLGGNHWPWGILVFESIRFMTLQIIFIELSLEGNYWP